MRKTLRVFAVLLLALCVSAEEPTALFKVKVQLVEVYATIYDDHGKYVDGLARDRFEVREDGTPQQIMHFANTGQSLSCAILLDTSGSMAEALPRVKNSIVRLIDELGRDDSVAIYTFDRRLVTTLDFTTDKAAAKRAVLRTRAAGATALFDALSETAREISGREGKKALIVFTDGDDDASALNANAAVTRAKKLGVPLYSIAEGEASHSATLQKVLRDLSDRTGGTMYHVKKLGDIERVFGEITQDLQHLYFIAYKPKSASGMESWRRIDLAVKGLDNYKIRAKQGYFPQ